MITTWSTTCGSRSISIADSLNNTVCNNTLYATVFGTACLQACGDGAGTLLENNIYRNRTDISGTKYTSSHNLDAKVDPLFVDPAALNFQLQPGSRAKDAGMVIHPYTDGFVGSAPDIGAFEFGAKPGPPGLSPRRTPMSVSFLPAHASDGYGRRFRCHSRLAGQRQQRNQLSAGGQRRRSQLYARRQLAGRDHFLYRLGYHLSLLPYLRRQWAIQIGVLQLRPAAARRAPQTAIAAWTHSAASNPAGSNWWDFWCDTHNWVKYSDVYFDASLDEVNVTYSTDAGRSTREITSSSVWTTPRVRSSATSSRRVPAAGTTSSGQWDRQRRHERRTRSLYHLQPSERPLAGSFDPLVQVFRHGRPRRPDRTRCDRGLQQRGQLELDRSFQQPLGLQDRTLDRRPDVRGNRHGGHQRQDLPGHHGVAEYELLLSRAGIQPKFRQFGLLQRRCLSGAEQRLMRR